MLERSTALDDEGAHRRVIRAQDPEQLLGLGGLGEVGEAAQVGEEGSDLASVTGQELLTLRARDQRRDLGRDESGELGPLAVDRLHEPGVLDGDGGLLGEAGHEEDLGSAEWPDLAAAEPDDADHVAFLQDRNAQEGPNAVLLCRGPVVLEIGSEVVHLDGLSGQDHPTGHRVATGPVGMLAFERHVVRVARGGGDQAIQLALLLEVNVSGFRPAQPARRLGHDVEDDLQVERGAADDLQDFVGRRLAVERLALEIA